MAFTDKSIIAPGATLSIAAATENPVKATLGFSAAAPTLPSTSQVITVALTTDAADGIELVIALKHQGSGHTLTTVAWPANVKWDGGRAPTPVWVGGYTAIYKLLRDNAANIYHGRMVSAGTV